MLSAWIDGHHPVGWVDIRRIGNLLVNVCSSLVFVRMVLASHLAVKACKRITQIEASYHYPQEQQAAKATMSEVRILHFPLNATESVNRSGRDDDSRQATEAQVACGRDYRQQPS
jgi:hypothetical protein